MGDFDGWTFAGSHSGKNATPRPAPRPPRSPHTIIYPPHTRQAHAPGVGEAIAARMVNDDAGDYPPMPQFGCRCLFMANRYGGRSNDHPEVSVNHKRYSVLRELYRVTHDIADMPKALYRHCDNKGCVQPYHYKVTVPKGRRGGVAKLSPSQVYDARIMHAAGWTWEQLGERFGVSEGCVRKSVKRLGNA